MEAPRQLFVKILGLNEQGRKGNALRPPEKASASDIIFVHAFAMAFLRKTLDKSWWMCYPYTARG